ncbi:MAG: M24 family metallopeptidase [Zavarzinella sp.]
MLDIAAVQQSLQQFQIDGWLLYDFRASNILARSVVKMPTGKHLTRRWYYFIPAHGQPMKLCHKIEPQALDFLPGETAIYLSWQELEAGIAKLLEKSQKIAMEYVPRNANPYVSRVDGGTIELIKSFGKEIVSSGDLIQLFEAVWDDEQWAMHLESAKWTRAAFDVAFDFIASEIRSKGEVSEIAVQQRIMQHFAEHNLITDHAPIVGQGPHSGDPHYSPEPATQFMIRKGDFVLVDLWAKLNQPRAVYSDYTRTCFVGDVVPEKYVRIFNIVAAARDAGIDCVRKAFAENRPLQGWEVDDATRKVIVDAGYGPYFSHRTGHNIGFETHGNGAHMDNLETREERYVLPRTCFSIEPGIYLPEFGVRSEVNVFVDAQKQVHVTGGELQTEIHRIVV